MKETKGILDEIFSIKGLLSVSTIISFIIFRVVVSFLDESVQKPIKTVIFIIAGILVLAYIISKVKSKMKNKQ